MPKLNLLEILKNTIVEQAPVGLYNYGDVGKYGLDLTTNKAVKIEKRDPSKISTETINDIDSPYLIKPSTKRGSKFGDVRGYDEKRRQIKHKGVDYPVNDGTLLVYIKNGAVTRAGNIDPKGWGNMVEIVDSDGNVTRYAHLSEINVSDSTSITPGTIIGSTGGKKGSIGAGNSKGPHLHLEYLIGGNHVDPGTGLDDETFRFLNKSDKDKFLKTTSDDDSNDIVKN